jgi:GMC oxidoreductase
VIRPRARATVFILLGAIVLAGCAVKTPLPGSVADEARRAGRAAQSFPAADEDYFREMDQNKDGLVALTANEVKGRNAWIVWTGGNDRFWDTISRLGNGALDFLKTLSSHPALKYGRDNRWYYLGLVNEPCFVKATGPDPARFGLWLDTRDPRCPPDPFENATKHPGVAIGARGKNLPVGSYYGQATGIVGLRLFPNPDFAEAAARRWDPKRYYEDPTYYNSRDLVKPYRVGMSCGFCHVGPNPIRPPADPENPRWENLSSNVGAQYFWVDRIFVWDQDPTSYVRATREVILSAGAYITPQLLMLSGIGPADELRRHHIDVRLDRPGVGGNLQDRYEVGVVARSSAPFALFKDATFRGPAAGREGDRLFETWRAEGRGVYATNGAVLGFLARSSVAEHDEPDLFIFGVPGAFTGYYTGWSADAVASPYDKWTWLLLKAHARFRGQVTLRSSDPLEPPAIDFKYFDRGADGALTADAATDLVAMREGVRLITRLLDGSSQLTLHPDIMRGIDLASDAGIDEFVQDRAWGHHASCTCKIGGPDDPQAVLDSSFRVRGVSGLRVVDASVFPRVPGFFLVMPVYMIAEKAADAILADARAGGRR